MNKTELYIYGARDTSTGKLVSDITNPKRKYWDRKGNAEKAIADYNWRYANKEVSHWSNRGKHGIIELVVFKLVEANNEQGTDDRGNDKNHSRGIEAS